MDKTQRLSLNKKHKENNILDKLQIYNYIVDRHIISLLQLIVVVFINNSYESTLIFI